MDNSFYIIAALLVFGVVAFSLNTILSSVKWTQTEGVIVHAEMDDVSNAATMTGSGSRYSYKIDIKYTYSVSGKEYTGTKIVAAIPNIFERKQDAEEIIAKYPIGAPTAVYFNPSNPKASALIAGKQINSIAIVALGLLAATVISGIIWVLRSGLLDM